MARSLLLLLVLLLVGCDGEIVSPFGGDGSGFGVPGGTEEEEEEPTPEFVRDGMTIDFTLDVDGSSAEVDYLVTFWADLDRDVINCDQRWAVDGAIASAPTGCPNCGARIVMIPASAVDVSEPLQRGGDCDPALLAASGSDFGRALLTPEADQGLADLLELAWISPDAHSAAGGTLDAQGDLTFALMEQVAANMGREYAGVVLLNDLGGLSTNMGLPDVAGDLGGTGWSPFFFLLRDPLVNDHEGPDLQGAYEARSVITVQFAQ